ncbi:MAG: FtsX-like permease family protein [Reyranellaceae bacterium]
MALGVATLIVVLSVMGGFRQQLLDRIMGLNGHRHHQARQGVLEATPELLEWLAVSRGQGRPADLGATGAQHLRPADAWRGVARCAAGGSAGARPASPATWSWAIFRHSVQPGVVMGERLRQPLNARPGDRVTVVTHRLNESGTIAPRYTDYELLGSFLTRRYEFDNSLVFVPLAMLREELEYGDRAVSSLDLDLVDPQAAPKVAQELRKALGRDDLRFADWLGLNARFVGALQVERVLMFIILSLIVVVAAMNVVASFTMLVRVKRGSIAILRTMGAAPRTIVRAFFMSAAAVGLVGTAVGAALGLLVCANMPGVGRFLSWLTGATGRGAAEVDFITSMPVRVQVAEVTTVVGVAVLLSLAAASYPAWRSTHVDPVEGLRHE